MKVGILAGGLGTRLGEETGVRPKLMVGIGGYPILWHIMKIYSHFGFNKFVVLCISTLPTIRISRICLRNHRRCTRIRPCLTIIGADTG